MKKSYLFILVLGIIFKIFLSAATFHPDIRAFDLGGSIVSSGNVFNLYDYLSYLDEDDLLLKVYPVNLFIYPPLIYVFHGIFSLFFTPLVQESFLRNFLIDYQKALGDIQLNFHLLFLKLPYLLFDITAAFLITKFFSSAKEKLFAFSLWMFNPVNLHATYMMGQFDIIATFFVIAALYILVGTQRRDKVELAAVALGFGAAFKLYPLFLLIPLTSLKDSWNDRIKIGVLGVLPYLITVAPFLFSPGYRASALVAGHTLKSFYSQIPISGGESIIIFLAALIFFYALFFSVKVKEEFVWSRFFIILLLFFIFTHYHPQWFLWITPLLIIDLIRSNFKNIFPFLLALISYIGLLFFFDPSLTIGLFSPVWPNLYDSTSIWEQLHITPDYTFSRSVLHTVFVGSALYYIYLYFPRRSEI